MTFCFGDFVSYKDNATNKIQTGFISGLYKNGNASINIGSNEFWTVNINNLTLIKKSPYRNKLSLENIKSVLSDIKQNLDMIEDFIIDLE